MQVNNPPLESAIGILHATREKVLADERERDKKHAHRMELPRLVSRENQADFFCAALTFAHRAFWLAAIFLRAATDTVFFLDVVPTFCF